ncbi:MAG: Crp/Fnr family transcriptional regulator [Candidatus Electrothrix aestuarii]|uniref:Crp/Fnr family transcriptional regulator n=1 Tax=Candidatus Electrothrix aestuarii TaxID=3062594 RepID=A0AAU8LWB0_9BACT|nr:Crp/Fnr family transcriptional regulator [Candidatus Electrothrix aestuarii]
MLTRDQKKTILAGSILFQGLSDELINLLANLTLQKQYQKGETIFLEGGPVAGFYLVAQGQVKIFKSSPNGKEQIFYALGPGEPFGLTPLFHNQKFPACAASMIPSIALFFPKTEFLQMTKAHHPLAHSMLAGLSQRLCRLSIKLGDLALKEVPQRLIAHFIYLSEEQNRTDRILLDMPKSQLACLLGTSPENLSRILAHMTREGLIRVQGNMIELLRYNELRQYS